MDRPHTALALLPVSSQNWLTRSSWSDMLTSGCFVQVGACCRAWLLGAMMARGEVNCAEVVNKRSDLERSCCLNYDCPSNNHLLRSPARPPRKSGRQLLARDDFPAIA